MALLTIIGLWLYLALASNPVAFFGFGCCCDPCPSTCAPTRPANLTVVFTGWANGTCIFCNEYNATWIVPAIAAASPCGVSGGHDRDCTWSRKLNVPIGHFECSAIGENWTISIQIYDTGTAIGALITVCGSATSAPFIFESTDLGIGHSLPADCSTITAQNIPYVSQGNACVASGVTCTLN